MKRKREILRPSLTLLLGVGASLGLSACGKHLPGAGVDLSDKAIDTTTNSFATLDWAQLRPPDDVPLRRSMPLQRRRGVGQYDDEDPFAASGLAAEMGAGSIDHSSALRAEQFGSFKTVATLEGRRASLPGYVVPLEFDDHGDMTEFLFVPFFGACIHVPPPPPNQVIYAHLQTAVRAPELWDAFELHGSLRTHKVDADVASAAYSMDDPVLVRTAASN